LLTRCENTGKRRFFKRTVKGRHKGIDEGSLQKKNCDMLKEYILGPQRDKGTKKRNLTAKTKKAEHAPTYSEKFLKQPAAEAKGVLEAKRERWKEKEGRIQKEEKSSRKGLVLEKGKRYEGRRENP